MTHCAGHYGEVRKVLRKSDGVEFALKIITKKRPIYVEILKSEVSILSVRMATQASSAQPSGLVWATRPEQPGWFVCLPARDTNSQNTDHPGIIKMVDKFEEGSKLYLVRLANRLQGLFTRTCWFRRCIHQVRTNLCCQNCVFVVFSQVFEICTGGELFEPIADSSVTLTERQSARVVSLYSIVLLLTVYWCRRLL